SSAWCLAIMACILAGSWLPMRSPWGPAGLPAAGGEPAGGVCAMAPAPTVASRPARTKLLREVEGLNANFMDTSFQGEKMPEKSAAVTYGFWLQVESKCGGRLFPRGCGGDDGL